MKNKKTIIFVSVIYALLFYRAFFTFTFSFDYLWYHLPIALNHFGKTTYVLTGFEQSLLEALPPLTHYVQGGLVALFDIPHLGNAVNSVGFILVTFLIWKLRGFQFSLQIFLLAMLGIPIFVAQLYSGFIDNWVNLWFFLAFVAYFDLVEKGASTKNLTLFGLGALFATLSKYQMWPVVGLLCLFAFCEVAKAKNKKGIFVLLAFGVLIAAWPVRNLVKFGNPTHPYVAPGFSFLKKDPSVSLDTEKIVNVQLYEGYKNYPRPVLFLMSAFEVTRLIPHEYGMQWTYEQWAMGEVKNPNYRMGGWSFLTVFFFIWVIFRAIRQKQIPKRAWMAYVASILLVSILPQSYELRYYLFIPFMGAFVLTEFYSRQSEKTQKRLRAFMVVSALLVVCSRALLPYEPRQLEDYYKDKYKTFWENPPPNSKENPVCVDEQPNYMLFWAGPKFNSVWIRKCD